MSAFYNEFDPKAAAWLRELISAGHIAPGVVDERSISEIQPDELRPFTQVHFFAGIGGWSLALRLAGWPDERPVWTGSCPCQPFSDAGKGLGESDPRHLWPDFFRLIRECSPPIVFGEQVASKAALGWLDGVFADLEGADYACAAADLCAASVGAPHIRQRLFWMADANLPFGDERARGGQQSICDASEDVDRMEHASRIGREQRRPKPDGRRVASGCGIGRVADSQGDNGRGEQQAGRERGGRGGLAGGGGLGDAERERREGQPFAVLGAGSEGYWSDFDLLPCRDGKARRVESGTFPLAHGIPGRVGLLRGYGNAIVPQVAAEFIQAAVEAIALNVAGGGR